MKKSRIIVPALALLCLSTAATISGSVAWFTANRTFNTTVSSFHVARLDGNLACTMDTFGTSHATAYGASYNATPLNSDGHVNEYISVETGAQLLNASYDHVNNKLFYSEDGGATILEKTSVADWKHDRYNNVNYYYAVKWQMTFTFHYTIDVTPQELYFDATSTIEATNGASGHDSDPLQAKRGFRMAFIGGTKKVVWAPEENETESRTVEQQQVDVDLCTFILNGATTPAKYSTEGNGNLVAKDTTNVVAKADEAVANDKNKMNYIGTFGTTPTANTDETITLTAIAWFEGTDENIVDSSYIDQTIKANMSFFVHKQA